MREIIYTRRTAGKKEERYDLFANLLEANDDLDGSTKLSESELLGKFLVVFKFVYALLTSCVGNIFMFLLAGKCIVNTGCWLLT